MPPQTTRASSQLDAREPLVIDTRELGRRPGSMRAVARSVPAPADLGVDVLAVPTGSAVGLDLRLESVMEGVLVSGTATAQLAGECVRCLDAIQRSLVVNLQELFAYPGADRYDEEDELFQLQGDLLDLEPVLRDAVVLAIPFQPLCSPDCSGLCPQCGVKLDEEPGHEHPETDPRWAALTALTDQIDEADQTDETDLPEPTEER